MVLLFISISQAYGEQASIKIIVDQPGIRVSPTLYGIFFEEINRAGDGGIYAEMLENRSFEDLKDNPACWTSSGTAKISLDRSQPLNDRNPTALKVEMDGLGTAINRGFKNRGLAIRKDAEYVLSLYARAGDNFKGPLTVRIEGADGQTIASGKTQDLAAGWNKFTVELKAQQEDLDAKLSVESQSKGTFFLDMVSLFPKETWKGHGMRIDLAEKIATMKPAFVRFPGGCFVEGNKLSESVRWKETIGDPAQRRGNWCMWGYQTTGGFGAFEFFQWCEDLDSEPLYVINCGMSHSGNVPMDKMDEYVQDALDLIEYARGPADSKWGSLRAKAGHPAPFKLNYIEIGNENGGPAYHERYALFHDAIKSKYPDIKLIACVWGGIPKNRKLDLIDEHYYLNPIGFMRMSNRYDKYDRNSQHIYVGEYAVTHECGKGNLIAALGEAAYMTGMERNGDIVDMCSYAPLFVNPDWQRWNPNAIVFDKFRSYGTPSYHLQCMFSNNKGDVNLPVTIEILKSMKLPTDIGVGTWLTQAEFKDIKVEKDGKTVFESDFSVPNKGWKGLSGKWENADGVLKQTSNNKNCCAIIGDGSWGDKYTLMLNAKKTGGSEGFLIMIHAKGLSNTNWWNLGGWGNTRHALEGYEGKPGVNGSIEIGRWYRIKVEVDGGNVKCYLDDKLIQEGEKKNDNPLFAVAGKNSDGKETILKLVNTSDLAIDSSISLEGAGKVKPTARTFVMNSRSGDDENTFDNPGKIVPKSGVLENISPNFKYAIPPFSVSVIRIENEK